MTEQSEYTTSDTSAAIDLASEFFTGFADREYRTTFAEESLRTAVAFQIRAIREQRGWTQEELGELCGGKAQNWISQLENPNYGRFSLSTLIQLAHAFDCMLDVRFKSFRDFSDDQGRRRPGDLRVNTYDQDAQAQQAGSVSGTDDMTAVDQGVRTTIDFTFDRSDLLSIARVPIKANLRRSSSHGELTIADTTAGSVSYAIV